MLTLFVYSTFYSGIFLLKPVFFLLRKVIKRGRRYFYTFLKILFFIGLVAFCFFYIPSADKIWFNLKGLYTGLIKKSLLSADKVDVVFQTARFFRFFYPAGIAFGAALLLMISSDRHLAYFWHRFLLRFSHKQLMPLVIFWTFFWIFEVLGDYIGTGIFASFFVETLMNCCLYFSFFYIIYGFLIINYLMKKRGIPYTITTMVVYGAIIVSGDFIIYIMIILMGFGITDAWMDYTKKKIKFSGA